LLSFNEFLKSSLNIDLSESQKHEFMLTNASPLCVSKKALERKESLVTRVKYK